MGKQSGIYHQYKIYASNDGKKWTLITDKSNNQKDVPHDYIVFDQPVKARYVKLENIHMPTGKFAISGLRIFGKGNGAAPSGVKEFIVLRTERDKRSAMLKWQPDDQAYAYNIYYGTAPDKLYNCIMVHDANDYYFKGMDSQKTYYFTIESINENGISPRYKTLTIQ